VKRYLVRAILGLLLTVVLIGHIAEKLEIPFVNEVENLLYDARVRLTAPGGKDERIVIVAIDEASLQVQGHWPWTRDKLAKLVSNLFDQDYEEILGFARPGRAFYAGLRGRFQR